MTKSPWRGRSELSGDQCLAQGQCSWYHPFYPKFFLSLNRTSTSLPARSLIAPNLRCSMKVLLGLEASAFKLQLITWKVRLQLPDTDAALRLLSFCAGTRCPLRRAINHNYNSAWQSLIPPLWGSVHSSPPSRPLPLKLPFRRSMLLSRLLFIWPPVPRSPACERELSAPGFRPWCWRVLSPPTQITGSTVLQMNFCLWLLNKTQKKKKNRKPTVI